MDSQLTVRLPEDLRKALDRASRQTGLKSSEIMREALRGYLNLQRKRGDRPAARVRRLIGSLETGVPDLAEKHREYVIESLTRG
jgi:metal-responsive CopG/Arc/MetJ family transcriptional regulator